MCVEVPSVPGPFDDLINDATGVTQAKQDAKDAAKAQAEADAQAQAAAAQIKANQDAAAALAAQTQRDQMAAAAAAAAHIRAQEEKVRNTYAIAGTSSNAAEVAQRNAAISAANSAAATSQGILSKQKKKKKGLRISPKDAYAKGEGSAGTTSASLKIGSQGVAAGTGTNLPV